VKRELGSAHCVVARTGREPHFLGI